MNNYQIIIPQRLAGARIDFAISEMLPKLSRSKITTAIKEKKAVIANQSFKAKDKVIGGEIVNFTYESKNTTNWIPNDIALNIVFEDDDIIVINKPAGLITHPGNGNPTGTLANALLNYNQNLAQVDRVGIVHRLDKDTSGLLVVAKHNEAQQHLIQQLQTRVVHREYSAIIYSHMIAGGTINKPIGRDSRNRIKQAVNETGKEAITHYRIIKKFKNFTVIKVNLETGRTHQIRVHLSSIGHPLVGDSMYGTGLRLPKGANDVLKNALKRFTRQALHAQKLEFIHPARNELVAFTIELATDMQNFIKVLQTNN